MPKNAFEMKRTNSICPKPEELLLDYVKNNETTKIRDLIKDNPKVLEYEYGLPHYKTIIQIACSGFFPEVTPQTIETLIELGADLSKQSLSHQGKEAIHFAATSSNERLLKTICDHLTQEEIDSTASGDTALLSIIKECDCESKNTLKCIKVLLAHNADANKADKNDISPILHAARKGYREVIAILLENRIIDIDTHTHRKKTARDLILEKNLYDKDGLPSRMIISNNNSPPLSEMFRILRARREDDFLELEGIKDVVNESDGAETMLQICARLNLPRCAKALVEFGADVDRNTPKCEDTPLEIAAKNGFYKVFAELLQNEASHLKDVLSEVLRRANTPSTDQINHKKCLELLLKKENLIQESLLNRKTPDGNTPLHFASRYTDNETTLLLLNKGASLGNANNFGRLPIEDIEINTLRNHFDGCITCSPAKIDDNEFLVTFDYKTLLPSGFCTKSVDTKVEEGDGATDYELLGREVRETDSEMNVISHIAQNKELCQLLTHPLITSFIYLKWHRISYFFYTNLVLYVATWLSLTPYIFMAYNNPNYEEEPTSFKAFTHFLLALIWVTFFFLTIKELFQLVVSPLRYLKQIENVVEIALIVSMGFVLFQSEPSDNTRKQISAIAILVSAFQLVLLIGQHPKMSTSIVMLRTVSYSFFKFFMWHAILIIAFALSFYTLFNDNTKSDKELSNNSSNPQEEEDAFNDPGVSLFKTFVMLTGEFDASDINFKTFPITSRILFVVFIFMIAIVLFNLLNGLAVSDTQVIKSNAELFAYKSRIDHICYVENMLLGNLAFVPSKLLKACESLCCCLPGPSFKVTLPKKLSKLACLFPNYLNCFEMDVYLNKEGKIKLPRNKKHVRLDKKTLKNVRVLLKERNSLKEADDSLQKRLQAVEDQQNQILEKIDAILERLNQF